MCPICKNNLYGSASRGKLGKHYPAYHCNKKGHYFRINVKDFDETITNFVNKLKITKDGINKLKLLVLEEWAKRIKVEKKESSETENTIMELKAEQTEAVRTMRKLTSDVAINLIEKDINKLEIEITNLKVNKKKEEGKDIPMDIVMEVVCDYLEHLEFLLLEGPNPIKRAAYFGVVFEEAPTYQDLISGTPKLAPYIELTKQLSDPKFQYVGKEGVEPSRSCDQ